MDELNRAEFKEWLEWYDALPIREQKIVKELVFLLATAGSAKEACKMARAMFETAKKGKK